MAYGELCLSMSIVTVFGPASRVIGNVSADLIQFGMIADDAVVVITLPDGKTGEAADFIYAFGDDGFELTNHGAN